MKLFKVRSIVFNRLGEDEFIAQLIDKQGNVVMTMEPRIIEEGENYSLEFPNDVVVAGQKMPENPF